MSDAWVDAFGRSFAVTETNGRLIYDGGGITVEFSAGQHDRARATINGMAPGWAGVSDMMNRRLYVRVIAPPESKVIIGANGQSFQIEDDGTAVVGFDDWEQFCSGLPGGGADVGVNIDFLPPPVPVPVSVTMHQARIQMHRTVTKDGRSTLLADTLAATKALGPEAEIAMEYATEVHRNGDLVKAIATEFGLTDDDLDGLFRAAAAIA